MIARVREQSASTGRCSSGLTGRIKPPARCTKPDTDKKASDAEFDTQYPSGYIYPFHFKHPVTGKTTSEVEYNATLKLKPNRFRPKE
jgi:hypothetical protein